MSEKEAYTSEFYVAGVRFHKFSTVKDILLEGDTVDLIPEPSNKYDRDSTGKYSYAVKIKHQNVMLGYVPKKLSKEVSEMLSDSGTDLKATIVQLQPDFEPWTALRVKIEEVSD